MLIIQPALQLCTVLCTVKRCLTFWHLSIFDYKTAWGQGLFRPIKLTNQSRVSFSKEWVASWLLFLQETCECLRHTISHFMGIGEDPQQMHKWIKKKHTIKATGIMLIFCEHSEVVGEKIIFPNYKQQHSLCCLCWVCCVFAYFVLLLPLVKW